MTLTINLHFFEQKTMTFTEKRWTNDKMCLKTVRCKSAQNQQRSKRNVSLIESQASIRC